MSTPSPRDSKPDRPAPLKRSSLPRRCRSVSLGLGWLGTAAILQAQLVFNFNAESGTSAQAIAGFEAAGARWSSILTDNVTINIDIAFKNLGANILGSAGSTMDNFTFFNTKVALVQDATSTRDTTASLSTFVNVSIPLLINRTSDNPHGSGSATPFLDNDGSTNNAVVRMSTANAKALKLLTGNRAGVDSAIAFSNAYTWDFDPSDGIAAGAHDFVGAATHEIGHALGFFSGVDMLDQNAPPLTEAYRSNSFNYVSTLDLFRFSSLSESQHAIDWTADTRAKFFSIDGGATFGPQFSTGVEFGDGRQASHWKDNLGLGIMDPTAADGEHLAISANDVIALDVIGWDVNSFYHFPVPNPIPVGNSSGVPDQASVLVLLGIGMTVLVRLRRDSAAAAT